MHRELSQAGEAFGLAALRRVRVASIVLFCACGSPFAAEAAAPVREGEANGSAVRRDVRAGPSNRAPAEAAVKPAAGVDVTAEKAANTERAAIAGAPRSPRRVVTPALVFVGREE